jgi:hypothetical protein
MPAFRKLPVVAAGLALAVAGCASGPPLQPEGHRSPPLVTTTADQAGVRDLRGAFRTALCDRLAGAEPGCDKVLTRMGGEPPPDTDPFPSVEAQASRYRIGIVPGFLAECLDDEARPYAAEEKRLRAQGFEVVYLKTTGRGSVAINAYLIAQQIAALPPDPRPFLVFGYSKGMPETLDAIVKYPAARGQIAAVVGMAGAVMGSPLVDRHEDLYESTLMGLPLGHCAADTGDGVHDLRRDVRIAWWAKHGREIHVPLYSLVALPERERVSPVMAGTHAQLSDIDPNNDGQLLSTEAIAVPGALLGYVNADHWAMAMRLSLAFPLLASSFIDDVPRGALLGAAIAVVVRDLEKTR